jgi:hypothetical protein
MKDLTIISGYVPVQEDEFEFIERQYGLVVPNNLRQLLIKYNGAIVQECCYADKDDLGNPIIDDDRVRGRIIERFVRVVGGEFLESINKWLMGYNAGFDPEETGYWMPVAASDYERYYLISLNEPTYGKIYFTNFELLSFDKEADYVCESLEVFVDSLITENEAYPRIL